MQSQKKREWKVNFVSFTVLPDWEDFIILEIFQYDSGCALRVACGAELTEKNQFRLSRVKSDTVIFHLQSVRKLKRVLSVSAAFSVIGKFSHFYIEVDTSSPSLSSDGVAVCRMNFSVLSSLCEALLRSMMKSRIHNFLCVVCCDGCGDVAFFLGETEKRGTSWALKVVGESWQALTHRVRKRFASTLTWSSGCARVWSLCKK